MLCAKKTLLCTKPLESGYPSHNCPEEKLLQHKNFIEQERVGYKKKLTGESFDPARFFPTTIYCTDQFACGIPHFTVKKKAEKDCSAKVKNAANFLHSVPNHLHFYNLTDEYETGANYTVETSHRYTNNHAVTRILPKTFFLNGFLFPKKTETGNCLLTRSVSLLGTYLMKQL